MLRTTFKLQHLKGDFFQHLSLKSQAKVNLNQIELSTNKPVLEEPFRILGQQELRPLEVFALHPHLFQRSFEASEVQQRLRRHAVAVALGQV